MESIGLRLLLQKFISGRILQYYTSALNSTRKNYIYAVKIEVEIALQSYEKK